MIKKIGMMSIISLLVLSVLCGVSGGRAASGILHAVDGEACLIFDDFRETRLKDTQVFSYDNVVGNANTAHALLPAEAWGASVNTGKGHIIYRIKAREGCSFEGLILDYSAKVSHIGNSSYLSNNLELRYGFDGTTWLSSGTVTAEKNEIRDFSTDFSAVVSGKGVVFIRFDLNNVTAEALPLAYVGVKLYTVQIAYRYAPDPASETLVNISPESLYAANNWSGTQLSPVASGMKYYGDGYYKKPIDMQGGITLRMNIDALHDKDIRDCWLSFSLLCAPAKGNYASINVPGLHFMIYYTGSVLRYNLVFLDSGGQRTALGNGLVITPDDGKLTVTVVKSGTLYNYCNTVDVYVNGRRNPINGLKYTRISDLTDQRGYMYLGVGAHGRAAGLNDAELRSMTVTAIEYADKNAPEISLSFENGVPDITVGSTALLPQTTVFDKCDKLSYSGYLLDPDGYSVEITDGAFVPKIAGEYTYIVKAVDGAGNFTVESVKINVKN